MNYLWAREHLEALALARDAGGQAGLVHAITAPPSPAAIPPGPATAQVLAAIAEPLGLAGYQLPAYGTPGPGCCRECLRPPLHTQGLCVYCAELAQDEPCEDRRGHRLERAVVVAALLCLAWVALGWATGMIR